MDVARLLDSLRRAVERAPDDDVLRTHLAEMLLQAGAVHEAIAHAGRLLVADPSNPEHLALMRRATQAEEAGSDARPGTGWASENPAPGSAPADSARNGPAFTDSLAGESAPGSPAPDFDGFDWGAAESDLVTGLAHDPVTTTVRLADVGGLTQVKAQLEAAFLTPLRNPELRARYGATLRGGLLLYGPPGCGKTHLARAVAGELGARFIAVSLADVLSRWMGQSEANVAQLFAYARTQAPCVVFLDEVDALGRSRSGLGRAGSVLRGVVNQLLTEFDGISSTNEGVFVLGATNAPWDVDMALRRPGRFDRTVFVEPPDQEARAQILTTHLAGLPVAEGLDVSALARSTAGFSGADLALVCRSAAQEALLQASRSGHERPISRADLEAARAGITPSTARWFDSARNVVLFADQSGEFAPLAEHMRAHRML